MRQLRVVQLHQLARSGSRTEDTQRAGAVKAALVVTWIDRFRHLAFDFDADQVRLEKRRSRCTVALGHRQRRGQRRRRGMREQSERAVRRRRQLRVVVVERVRAARVGERRVRRGDDDRIAAEDRRLLRAG